MDKKSVESELLLSIAYVAQLMDVSEWGVRQAMKRKRLRSEAVMIDNMMRVAIPLSAMAEYWNLPEAVVDQIESDARQRAFDAPVPVVKRLSTSAAGLDT